MSLHLEFEPHSWYMGFAIKKNAVAKNDITAYPWEAYTDDGMTYDIIDLVANTLSDLKREIRAYHVRRKTGYGHQFIAKRLRYLRGELEAERIGLAELVELQGYIPYIDRGDVQLLQAAGVPE